MEKLKKTFLYLSIFAVFTQGMWERIFDISEIVGYVIEIPIILFIFSPPFKTKSSPGSIVFLLYIFLSLISALLTQSEFIVWLKYIRFFIYFYLIYNQLWNTPLSYKEWKNLLIYLAFIIFIQGLGSLSTLLIVGRFEGYVGLMSSSNGATATTFSVLIISLTLLLYFYHRNSNLLGLILSLLFIAGAFLVGYVSTKRAIYFAIPVFIVAVTFMSFYDVGKYVKFAKKVSLAILIAFLMVPVFLLGLKNEHGYSYHISENESTMETISKAINFVRYYERDRLETNETIGRSGTTKQIVRSSFSDLKKFFFGFGVRSHKDVTKLHSIGVHYGIVGFTRDVMSIGWVATIFTIYIFTVVILSNKSYKTTITRAVRILLFLVFIFIHLRYTSDFTNHLKIAIIYAIICAFINSPFQAEPLRRFVHNNFISAYF